MSETLPRLLWWTARLAALLIVLGFAFLVTGEILTSPHHGPDTLREATGLILLSLAMLALLAAFRWELAGACLSLAALLTFCYLIRMRSYHVIAVMAIPGALFLADWLVRRHAVPSPPAISR